MTETAAAVCHCQRGREMIAPELGTCRPGHCVLLTTHKTGVTWAKLGFNLDRDTPTTYAREVMHPSRP